MRLSGILGRLLAVVMPLLVLSCSRPESDELFVRPGGKDVMGRYCFILDMDDPQYVYDVDVYIPTSADRRHASPFSEDVTVEWKAPSGARYKETVTFSSQTEVQRSFFNSTFLYHYRAGLVPVEYGQWKLSLQFPSDFEEKNHANGIGIRLIRNGSR